MGLGDIVPDNDVLDISILQQDASDMQKMLLQLRGVLIEEKLQDDVSFERMCEIEMQLEVLSRKCIGLTMMTSCIRAEAQGAFVGNWWSSFQCSALYFSLLRAQKRVRDKEVDLKTARIFGKLDSVVEANDRWYEQNEQFDIVIDNVIARQKVVVLNQLLATSPRIS